jgi:hypothetical protein
MNILGTAGPGLERCPPRSSSDSSCGIHRESWRPMKTLHSAPDGILADKPERMSRYCKENRKRNIGYVVSQPFTILQGKRFR